jgi:hypothetical protein
MKMEYTVEALRGWPHDGALDRGEPIKAGASLANGDWVVKQADNTVDKATTTATNRAGVVIRGNADSGSGAYVGKATVLWGNAILMVKNLPSGVTFTPGAPVTIRKNGAGTAYVDVGVVGTDPIIGFVLDVIAGSSTVDAAITMKF